jgi:cell division protein FtsW
MAAARQPRKRPLEYSILWTATLCLLAAGAVMVYSASSAESLISQGDASFYLKRYVIFGIAGIGALHLSSRVSLKAVKNATPVLLMGAFGLTVAAMLPGIGVTVNGATRWVGAGALQFQPSEMLKLALVLYSAQLLAARPRSTRTLGGLVKPLLLVVGAACLLLLKQPDMGTAMVICFAVGTLMIASGVPMRNIGLILGVLAFLAIVFAILEPYRRARLTSFVNPWAHASGAGFQSVQGQIAVGSGGFLGLGLGESVQKIFYLPEAHTDFILAVIGEELGVAGICGLLGLYGIIGYAGLRTARNATGDYAKLLAAGLTSLILCQALLNVYAVLGLAPLTGVPLPFISSGSTSLVVMLCAMGLLLNVASGGSAHLRAVPARRPRDADDRDRGGRDGRPRRSGDRHRRRAAG